jgi:hypothetical protein
VSHAFSLPLAWFCSFLIPFSFGLVLCIGGLGRHCFGCWCFFVWGRLSGAFDSFCLVRSGVD